jgi:hypothetical protein
MVRNDAGWEGEIEAGWLHPVIKSPREIRTLRVRLEDLHYLIFMPPEDVWKAIEKGHQPPLNRYPKAATYICWGERYTITRSHQGKQRVGTPLPKLRSLAGRSKWWAIDPKSACDFVCNRFFNDRLFFAYPEQPTLVDQTFYGGRFVDLTNTGQVAVLNSTLQSFFATLLGRVALGEGALQYAVYEMKQLIVLDIQDLTKPQLSCLLSAFEKLSQRPVRSIFEELGFELCRERRCDHPEHPYEQVTPEALTLEQVQRASPDRFELDAVIFDVLGLTDDERLAVYKAVAQLVKDRLVKARSV